MSFDKAKAMRNAERFLAQGKIRAAINEYQRVIESDKTDYSTLNMLGDLYAKASEPDEAVVCFSQVAEHYSKQGFAQKAIAIYNKISRLKPDSIEVSAKLAQLYQSKGSVAEARAHYATLAEQYSRKGKKAEALNIWKQIASLDPNNTDIYFKIADACWQNQQKEEAASAYIEAGKRLGAKKQYESAVTAYSRALEINPDDIFALKGFVESQVHLGYSDEAAKSLESSIARQPHNRELSYLLIDCYLDMGNLFEAEKSAVKLLEQEPSNYPKLLDLVQAYLKNSDLESATRILSMASEHLLVGGKAQTLENLVNEILQRNPEQLDAVRLLVRLNTWQRDEAGIKSSFEKLAEVARINNAVDDERYALEQLIMIVPQNAYFAQRLQELNLANGFSQGFYESPQTPNKNSGDVPTFESFSALTQHDEELSQTDAVLAEYGGDVNYVNGNGNGHSKGFQFADEKVETQTIDTENIVEESVIEESSVQISEDKLETVEPQQLSEFDLHNLQKEIEGIDFYIAQGFIDLAEKTLNELEERYGKHPEIDKLRESLNLPNTTPYNAEVDPEANQMTETLTEPKETVEEVEDFETASDNSVEDESFTIESETIQSLEDFARSQQDFAQNEQDFADAEIETVAVQEDAYEIDSDSTQEIETITQEIETITQEIETITQEIEATTFEISNESLPAIPTQTDSVTEFKSNVVSTTEFKSEVVSTERQPAENEDFEIKYQTGIAYKEMGLTEDAIREFQEAVRLVTIDDGTRRFFWCCNLLGHCFMEKRMPNIALMWYKRGLEAKNISEEESQGLRYELANAYELGGDKQMAIRYFEEIYAVNVDFRDVGKRLEKLMTA